MVDATMELNKTLRDGCNADSIRSICFVCTGNTCRSPMAAAVANARAYAEGLLLEAFSAGLYATEGEPISAYSVLALEQAGVAPMEKFDYRKHTAHTIAEEEIERFDLLVAMTRTHAMELLMRYPSAARKIVCMPNDISDPFGGGPAVYERCLCEICEGVTALLGTEAQ